MQEKTLGQVAYEAFGQALPGQPWGNVPWDSLEEIVRFVWEKTARGVRDELERKDTTDQNQKE